MTLTLKGPVGEKPSSVIASGSIMVLQYLLVLTVIISRFQAQAQGQVDGGTGPLDCVRIRSASLKRLIFGTGYFLDQGRYVGIFNLATTPYNSAFRIELIPGRSDPVYHIRMINTREYVYGGEISKTTHVNRMPVFSYIIRNETHPDSAEWVFEKAFQGDKWLGGWLIKNLYYQNYMIASASSSEPPPEAYGATFKTVKLDRQYQQKPKDDLMFFFEEC